MKNFEIIIKKEKKHLEKYFLKNIRVNIILF